MCRRFHEILMKGKVFRVFFFSGHTFSCLCVNVGGHTCTCVCGRYYMQSSGVYYCLSSLLQVQKEREKEITDDEAEEEEEEKKKEVCCAAYGPFSLSWKLTCSCWAELLCYPLSSSPWYCYTVQITGTV